MADELLVIGEEAFDTETNQPVWWDGQGWSYVKPRAPLTPQIRPANMPLSYAQQRLWFLDQLGGGASAEYNMPEAMRLRGELDLHALTRAINTIVARHESLRTHFAIVDGEPVQIIEPMLRIDVPVHDLRLFGEASRHEAIDAALRREWQQPFDLQRGPLLRVKVLELGERDRILLWTSHHIVSDGWSIGVISHELVALYEAFAEGRENPLEPLSIQYADFALWQRAWMEDGGLEEGLRYWKEQLRGIPERLELPADHPRPATQTFAADAVHASLSSDELAPVMRMTQGGGATLFMTLLTTFAVLLERYSGQGDIVIGSPIANRRETQLERLIGFFVNSLVMRVRVRTDLTFRELLAEVRQTTLDAYQHQDVPFERLVEELSPERNLGATPIFQVAFVLQNAPGGSARLRDLEIERVSSDELRVRFDMEIHAVESDGALTLAWVYNRDLFDRWRIEQMARHFVRLLADATARPDVPLHRLRMQEQRERYTLLEELNATSRAVPPQTFPRIFEEQVARTPAALAIVSGDESLTYAQLNERANRLAHHLIERGVGPERIVGISMLKSIDQWIAVLATMKAGGAYLPLDPDYPEERIQMMLDDAKPMFVLGERRRPAGWPGAVPAPPPEAGGETPPIQPALHEYPSHNPSVPLSLAHPAYIIYTSGSTGIPKGVVVTHAGIASLRAAQAERFAIDANARVLQFASLNFDASFAELAVTLGSGAALILPSEDERSGSLLRDLLARQRITHATLPPTVLATLDDLPLENLIVAGEPCPPDQVGRWSQGRRFINAYGPTETTVCATMSAPLSGIQSPPIGAPNLNTRVYVLDAALEPVPMGVNGELYVAGISLARGYLHRPGLTASRFVADPHGLPGTRMYRTGDVVRWRPAADGAGALDFIGRVDEQVKLRGFRIEPGEIEEALRRQDRVQDALVTIHGDGEQKQLLGYVTIRDDDATQSEAQATHISHWQQLYDATHAEAGEAAGDFNIRGWNSSYTGEPIPAAEMRIWVEETVARILALQPRRVLEIGCGTGLLLTRIAPSCEQYIGIDFSAPALAQLERYRRTRPDLDHVTLRTAAAHELSFLDSDSVDVVVINSVVQYFPDTDYLLGVLDEAARVTRRGGAIFIGDVRSLPLLDTFHASLSAQAKQNEKELVLDPALFSELARRREKLGRAEVSLKAGAYDNELSRFRYDVTLHVGAKQTLAQPERWIEWDADGAWREEVARTNTSIGVRGIPDARVLGHGEDPDAVMRLGLPYAWQRFNSRAIYDCIFRPQWIAQPPAADAPRAYYRRFGNEPLRGTVDVALSRSLQDALRKTVPEHMVPSAIVVMQSWPLTPSGKIDRRALPIPRRGDRAVTGFIEPQSETAKLLASLWESVLGLDRVGEEDNFFSLGGHSLMAAQLMSRVRDVFGVEVSVRTLFDAPQLRELAQSIEAAQRLHADIKPPLRPMERPPLVPLSYAQRRLWFLDKLQGASAEYNMPGAWRLRGALDVDALRRTLDTIVARHENLRVHFVERDGEPFQAITSELRVELPIEPATMDDVHAALEREAKESFDLSRGPLLRARLLQLDDSDHVLLLTLHHIVSDAWSMGVLHREFAALYEAFREGRPNPLPPLSVQYADFALWQRSWLDGDAIHRGLEYWKSQLAGIPDRLELQTDRPRPPAQTFVADVFELTLPPHRVEALKRLAQSNQATLFMTLLTAFAVLLERYSGQRDIVLGTPIANRQDRQLEDLIGFFVNSLVMRIDVRRGATFRELLLDVRRMTLEAYQHQDIPFERLVEELSLERSRNSTPIFQVVFAMQNAPSTRQSLPDLQIEPVAGEEPGVRFDLEVHAVESDGALQLSWVYNRDLFDAWRIEQMARDYTEILSGTPASSPAGPGGPPRRRPPGGGGRPPPPQQAGRRRSSSAINPSPTPSSTNAPTASPII